MFYTQDFFCTSDVNSKLDCIVDSSCVFCILRQIFFLLQTTQNTFLVISVLDNFRVHCPCTFFKLLAS